MQAPATYLTLLLLLAFLVHRLASAQNQEATTEEAPSERSNRILDHTVTREQATLAAAKFDLEKLGVSDEVGCGKCSLQERMYCVSEAVLSDHCCCDKHLEPMPFVPHKCYIRLPPAAPCMPISGNCAQYSRIFDCCCKHILQQRFPSRPTHHGWLASLITMMGLNNWSEREPAVDPVPPVRPLLVSPQGAPYHPFPSYQGSAAQAQAQGHSNFSGYSLSDEVPHTFSPNRTGAGHNKLVSGAHVAHGGLAALLATLAMLLFR